MCKWYSGDSQIRWVCIQLIKGREICQDLQIKESGGHRLSAIIHNLKKKMNWPIDTRYGAVGEAYYRLAKGVDKDALEKPRSFVKKGEDAGTSLSHDENS